MSGKDVRRLAARASTTTPEIKRDQVARAAIGAVAGGADRLLVIDEPFRISTSAVETLGLSATIEKLDIGAELRATDTVRAVEEMRSRDCRALIVLGGDGTNRIVAKAWPDAPLLPLSTGTNNVFPVNLEATSAGLAAGLVASGKAPLDVATRRVKQVHVAFEDEPADLALIDAAHVVDDAVGNYMPFEPQKLRRVVLSRAEPTSVGMSPIGGLLEPCSEADDYGVEVVCGGPEDPGRDLLVPLSPGLFRAVRVVSARKLPLGETVSVVGPGLLAFDGDRERNLADGQEVRLSVRRDGPLRIDAERTLRHAVASGAFDKVPHWHDIFDEMRGVDCC